MPIPIKHRKPLPKFRCEFCSYRATLPSVEKHEGYCFANPNRYCPTCKNTGFDREYDEDGQLMSREPCPYCSQEDKSVTESVIASRQQYEQIS